MPLASSDATTGLLSQKSEAQHKLLTLITEAIAFEKADPSLAQDISQGIVGGDPPPWDESVQEAEAPGTFETFV